MVWLMIYVLVAIGASIFAYKKTNGFLFYVVTILVFIAPYSGITVVSLYSVWMRICIPMIVILYILWKWNDLIKLLIFSFKKFLFLTISVFILYGLIVFYDMYFLGLSVSHIPINYLIKYFEFFWSVLFFLILFARVNGNRRLYTFKKIYFVILAVSSMIGFLTYLEVPIVFDFHERMYNLTIMKYGAETELFDFVRWYNRPYSIFSASNQFGLFAGLALIISLYLKDAKALSRGGMFLAILFQLFILVSSQSRTGFIIYVIIGLLTFLFKTSLKQKVLIFPLFLIIFTISLNFLPDRIMSLFSGEEGIVENLDSQRVYFWIKFYNSLSLESIFIGMPRLFKQENFTFFESGYLNIYFEGGIGLTILHFMQMKKIGVISRELSDFKSYGLLYSFVFIMSEIFQGTFINIRYGLFNGFIIAYILIKSYEFHSRSYENEVTEDMR